MPSSTARKVTLGSIGGLAVLAGATYVGGYAMAGDELPRNATAAGVQLGGLTAPEAQARLEAALEPKATAPITISGGAKSVAVKPSEAGMAVDYQATIAQADAGRSWSPVHIWKTLSGGGELQPVVRVDDKALAAAALKAKPVFAVAAKDATLALKDASPVLTPGVASVALDEKKTAALLKAAYLEKTTVEAPLVVKDPQVTTADAQKVLASTLKPTVSAPVVLTTPKGKLTLGPHQISDATNIQKVDGQLKVTTDMKKLYASSEDDRTELGLVGGKDARWQLVAGTPQVVPSTDGLGIRSDDFAKAVTPALLKQGPARTVPVKTTKQPAKLTTEAAKKLGVKEVTGEFTTHFPYAEYRNTNLSLAAASINNTFLEPGETFSLNDTLGPKGPGSGYVDGWVITGDHLTKENAGGVSQSATTTFNAAFFAGLEDVEHHPHTMYFDRYPAGREATVYYGNLDLRFRNNTPYGVLVQAFVNRATPDSKGSITVRVWSTKVYEVKSTELSKSNFTTGRTIHASGESCHAQAASPGFTVNYARLFYKGGALVRREPFSWTYSPTDEIICD